MTTNFTKRPYAIVNVGLLIAAWMILGKKFCVKTIYAVVVVTTITSLLAPRAESLHLLQGQPLWAAFLGAVFCGCGIGLGFSAGGSTGGTDIVAAIVNKYRDISLGRVIMICDIFIISSSYFVVHDWEKVLYGYVVLYVQAFCIDQVVNSRRRSVQFCVLARQRQSQTIFRLIEEIDPHAFVSQSAVIGVYGEGFDQIKYKAKKKEEDNEEELKRK